MDDTGGQGRLSVRILGIKEAEGKLWQSRGDNMVHNITSRSRRSLDQCFAQIPVSRYLEGVLES
jgi:hypothetical protein